jgi:hypothetical protein
MRTEDAVGRFSLILWEAREEGRLRRGDVLRQGRELQRAIFQKQEADAAYLAETDQRVLWCREVLREAQVGSVPPRAAADLEAVAGMLLGKMEPVESRLSAVGDQ